MTKIPTYNDLATRNTNIMTYNASAYMQYLHSGRYAIFACWPE
jgi:hypothetical protein